MIIHSNPKFDFLPQWLVDWSMNFVAVPLLNFICDMAMNLPIFFKDLLLQERDYYIDLADYFEPFENEGFGKYDFDEFMRSTFKDNEKSETE